jgi:uncharacterized protein YjlB
MPEYADIVRTIDELKTVMARLAVVDSAVCQIKEHGWTEAWEDEVYGIELNLSDAKAEIEECRNRLTAHLNEMKGVRE